MQALLSAGRDLTLAVWNLKETMNLASNQKNLLRLFFVKIRMDVLMKSYLLQIKVLFIKVDMQENLLEPVMIMEGKKSEGLSLFL